MIVEKKRRKKIWKVLDSCYKKKQRKKNETKQNKKQKTKTKNKKQKRNKNKKEQKEQKEQKLTSNFGLSTRKKFEKATIINETKRKEIEQ